MSLTYSLTAPHASHLEKASAKGKSVGENDQRIRRKSQIQHQKGFSLSRKFDEIKGTGFILSRYESEKERRERVVKIGPRSQTMLCNPSCLISHGGAFFLAFFYGPYSLLSSACG